ncbi:MAG: glucose-1-phosphate thymidylyltransferase [Bacteroidetes bacterium]|nr:MAG: glucose-1-phosphate thymidylyltransferase [Bacteroidota bacterium]
MNIILFDDEGRTDLLPLAYTRPCAEFRVGILTISEKWNAYFNTTVSFLTEDYLSEKFPVVYNSNNLYINGRLLPDSTIIDQIKNIDESIVAKANGTILAFKSSKNFTSFDDLKLEASLNKLKVIEAQTINFCHDIFTHNGTEIRKDLTLLTKGRSSADYSSSNTIIGEDIFIEEGVTMEAAVLNTTDGPIYIGKGATIMEGALIKGPFALCEGSTIKMGAKIYGDTTVGPQCKVGGEVSNSVFFARSNKGHDGYIGNSVIGEWCNLGADTNGSNLKNNYAQVKLWNYSKSRFINTGLQFCGLIMGDHSKCGINTMFNTGTVIGVSANIFGASFPRNFIPSFTWGGATGFATYAMSKALETARLVMQRRTQELTEIDKNILYSISEESAKHRFWENKPLNT